jgi:hypothetical protein
VIVNGICVVSMFGSESFELADKRAALAHVTEPITNERRRGSDAPWARARTCQVSCPEGVNPL